jgi:hypothetical protein
MRARKADAGNPIIATAAQHGGTIAAGFPVQRQQIVEKTFLEKSGACNYQLAGIRSIDLA